MNKASCWAVVAGIVVVLASARPAIAVIIFEQPASPESLRFGVISDIVTQDPVVQNARSFDDFRLSRDAIVTDVHWFGFAPFAASVDTANFIISFHRDAAGLPSLIPFYEESVIARATNHPNFPEVLSRRFSADPIPPVAFAADERIWISVVNNDPSLGLFDWQGATLGAPAVTFLLEDDRFVVQALGLAFALTARIPQPASFLLLVLGLIGLRWRKHAAVDRCGRSS